MNITVRKYGEGDVAAMAQIWNEVVSQGAAFPQEDCLDLQGAAEFFAAQSRCSVAADEDGNIVGMYILHPNNVGRCSHIANASYAVSSDVRGRHIGEALVRDSMLQARALGFKILQFNAVVESNAHARHLYERLGFVELGTIPRGFRLDSGEYENICVYYAELD